MKRTLTISLMASAALFAAAPNAGTLLRTVQPITPPQKPAPLPVVNTQHYAPAMQSKSNVKIMVKHLVIKGNTAFKISVLHALVSSYEGKKLTLSQLEQAADVITKYYRSHGYFVARAYIPAQEVSNDTITIEIIEGKYGKFVLTNRSLVSSDTLHGYLDPLIKEKALYYPDLERKLLLIHSLSGIKIASVDIYPGANTGESDFAIKALQTQRARLYAIGDDYGNISTGEYRITAGVIVNSPTAHGDNLNISVMRSTTGGLSNAQGGYTLPLGYSGFKANIFGSVTKYTLQGQYALLDAHGEAAVVGAGLSYPLILSQKHSLSLRGTYSHIREADYTGTTLSTKHVNDITATLNDNYHGHLFHMPANFTGSISFTRGQLALEDATAVANDNVLNAKGYFSKANFSLQEQLIPTAESSITAKLSGQNAFSKNLDSSEQFTIGGVNGVRAYTTSELSADKALLFSLDIDHTLPSINGWSHQAGIFYDTACGWLNSVAYTQDNTRQLSDIGVSYKADFKALFLTASFAHGIGVDATPLTQAKNNDNKFFVKAGVVF